MASNNPFPQQLQQLPLMIQQYHKQAEMLTNSITQLRQNLERTDLSQEEKNQIKHQEQEMQSKLAVYQTFLNNLTPKLTPAQQQMVMQQLAVNQNLESIQQQHHQQQQQQQHHQQQQQQQAPPSQPGSPAFPQHPPLNIQQIAAQQHQMMAMAGSPPQPMSATSSPRQPISTPLASLAPSKQNTPVATPTKGMFTFPTMSGPPPSANSAMTQKPTVPITPDLESGSRILGKRKIQELVGQIDPSERLEPEVEDILLEIADEFIESVTKFACRLAKHRKSDTLEVKDLQLHLERNWNVRIPGFAADEIRSLRKPVLPSSHQSKVQAVNTAKAQGSSGQHSKKDNN